MSFRNICIYLQKVYETIFIFLNLQNHAVSRTDYSSDFLSLYKHVNPGKYLFKITVTTMRYLSSQQSKNSLLNDKRYSLLQNIVVTS